jgi:hypothetical protein
MGTGRIGVTALCNSKVSAQSGTMLIDEFNDEGLLSKLGTRWRGVSDEVMAGSPRSRHLTTHQIIAPVCA